MDVAGPPRTAYGHSHGPLTNPHAAFDDNCSACHRTYSFKDFKVFNALDARDRWHDLTCEKCHSGPPHHATATKDAPWYVVPADNKWFTRTVVAAAVVETLASLDLKYPKVDKEKLAELAAAKRALLEGDKR